MSETLQRGETPTTWQADEDACALRVGDEAAPLYDTVGPVDPDVSADPNSGLTGHVIAMLPPGAGVEQRDQAERDGRLWLEVYSPRLMTTGWIAADALTN